MRLGSGNQRCQPLRFGAFKHLPHQIARIVGKRFGGHSGELFDCRIKGHFRLQDIRSTNPIAVGDNVEFEMNVDGMLIKIKP